MSSSARRRTNTPSAPSAPSAPPRATAPLPAAVHEAHDDQWAGAYVPAFGVAFRFLLACRLASATLNLVHDCDETFNYWEPLHHWLYGYGFQTWEYSPAFAIRSYAYVLLHALPAWPAALLYPSKLHVFMFVRVALAAGSALCDALLCSALVPHSRLVALLMLFMLATSSGMFVAATAFLPSSFAMSCVALAYAAWLNQITHTSTARRFASPHYLVAVGGIALAALLAWPFCGAMGVPIFIDFVVVHGELLRFALVAVAALVVILAPIVAIDWHYYGKLVVVPLAIVAYNVFSGDKGPDLYGTEPWTYYALNLGLNLNVAWPLALLSVPLTAIARPAKMSPSLWLVLLAPYLWLGIFFAQPHKEERFIYVIYPLLLMQAAFSLASLWSLATGVVLRTGWLNRWDRVRAAPTTLVTAAMLVFMLLSLSRSLALAFHYGGALETWRTMSANLPDVPHPTGPSPATTVCLGKEWYRFPSHFFLKEPYRIGFVKSDFAGLLPKYYEGKGVASTRLVPSGFNDLNREDPSRYVNLTRDCGWLVDLCSESDADVCPQDTGLFVAVHCLDFLDAAHSPPLPRAFYIPGVSGQVNAYGSYCLLRRNWSVDR